MAATLNTLSCGSGGLLTPVDSGSTTPTSTPTTGTGALAFVTNFNDGKVSSFKRNTTTGVLTHSGQVLVGAKKGPRGVVAAPSGSFLYVANLGDDNIYEFSINSTNGILTPLSPAFISNGSGTGPDQLAINSAGTLLWVTGAIKGLVTTYAVNTSTGQLTQNSSLGGFNTPFGLALHPSLSVLYMTDTGTGLIWPLSFDSNGKLSKGTAVTSPDVAAVTPGLVVVDSAGAALFTADQKTSEVSSFSITAGTGALTPVAAVQNSNVNDAPVGIGIAINNSNEYVFTANRGIANSVPGSVSSFLVTNSTTVITPPVTVPQAGGAPINGALGLVVDPQGVFVYTTDNFDGTISESKIKGSCGIQLCEVGLVSAEKPANANSGPFGITLAQ